MNLYDIKKDVHDKATLSAIIDTRMEDWLTRACVEKMLEVLSYHYLRSRRAIDLVEYYLTPRPLEGTDITRYGTLAIHKDNTLELRVFDGQPFDTDLSVVMQVEGGKVGLYKMTYTIDSDGYPCHIKHTVTGDIADNLMMEYMLGAMKSVLLVQLCPDQTEFRAVDVN